MRIRTLWDNQRRLHEYEEFSLPPERASIPAFGADIKHKGNESFRLATQNVNGFRFDSPRVGVQETDAIEQLGLDIFGLTETNINWTNNAKLQLNTLANLSQGHARTIAGSAPWPTEGYQPGGTAMIAQGRVAGRIWKRDADSLGRFTYMALQGRDDTGIIIFNVYRVCQKKGARAGPDTAFMQQYEGLRKKGITNPDPRKQLFDDLTDMIAEWRERNYHPIVMGDLNSVMTDKDLHIFMQTNGLHDLIGSNNNEEPEPTYARSARRLDFILGDQYILDGVDQSGALGLHEGVISDHTLQWVDLNTQLIFRNNTVVPTTPSERQFNLTNAIKKHAFQDKLAEIHTHQKIKERIIQLADDFEHLDSTDHADRDFITLVTRYQALDDEIRESIITAASTVSKRDFGYQRSPALVNSAKLVVLWKMVLSCKRRRTEFSERAHTIAGELGIAMESLQVTYKEAQQRLKDAIHEKRRVQKEDSEERAKWLEELAMEATLDKPDKDREQVLKEMIAAARQKSTQRKLTAIMKPPHNPLDYIEIPGDSWYYSAVTNELYAFGEGLFKAHPRRDDIGYQFHRQGIFKVPPNDSVAVAVEESQHGLQIINEPGQWTQPVWSQVTRAEEVEEWLCRRNKRHHQQVHIDGNPITTEPYAAIFGEHGTTPTVQQLLESTFDIDSLDFPPYVKEWLRWFQLTPEEKKLRPISPRITAAKFQAAFKVVDEMTSSSPSGLHYTLWKAIAEKTDFSEYFSLMMSLPFMYGFSHKRWQSAIDVMLEKKLGVRRIHLMRVIGLVEADFNTALKILFTRDLMWNAEQAGISPDQWGGRANRSAPDCATRKMYMWESARLAKRTVGSFFGDLASCFDRMKTCISSVVAMKKGMPVTVCDARSRTVRKMTRQVRTAAGTSSVTYREETGDVPLAGEIQGKGDVMGLWTLVSDSIISVHRKLTNGVTIRHVANGTTSTRSADAYVDDTDTYAELPNEDDNYMDIPDLESRDEEDDDDVPSWRNAPRHVIATLGEGAQLWTNLILMIGHLMAFHKCLWQLLPWMPQDGLLVPRPFEDYKGELHLTDHRGLRSKIKHLPYTEANDGLGFLLTPLGDQTHEFTKRYSQAKDCMAKISTATLTTTEAWLMLMTRIIPRVTYPFMLTSFSAKQLKKIAVAIDNVILPKLKINRHTPRAMVYAPVDFGGMDIPSIATIQDQKGISHFVRHLQWGREISKDTRIVLSQVQLESGLVEPIMEQPSLELTYLEHGHIAHLRERLRVLGGGVWIDDTWTPQLQRARDQAIMDVFARVKCKGATKRKLFLANKVRMWLRVITVAELADEGGRVIPADRFAGEWRADSTLTWPNSTTPTEKMFDAFRWYLRKSICSRPKRVLRRSPLPLDRHLGNWRATERHVRFDGYRTAQWLYRRQESQLTGATRIMRYKPFDGLYNTYYEDTPVDSIPVRAMPCEIYDRGQNASPIQHYRMDPGPAPPTPPTEPVTVDDESALQMAEAIIAVSDGSMDPISGRAAYQWIITTPMRRGRCACAKPVNSNPKYMTSFRAELAGIHDVLRYIRSKGWHEKTSHYGATANQSLRSSRAKAPPALPTSATPRETWHRRYGASYFQCHMSPSTMCTVTRKITYRIVTSHSRPSLMLTATRAQRNACMNTKYLRPAPLHLRAARRHFISGQTWSLPK